MVNAVAKYQKYAEYKDSGIDWLGSIPENWHLNKLRYLFDFNKGLTITKENLEDEGIPCVSYGEVHSKFGFEVDPLKHDLKCVNESYLKTSDNALLSKGDFIFADTSEDLKGSGNFTHLVNNELVFAGYHTIIAKPKDATSSRFYAYLFDSKEFRSQIQLAVKGVKVFSITQAILRASDIWLPSKSEQTQIANFLDHETAKIDSLIEKQQKLIELLKEKRQAVISHAVTKGLNPDVPMKDSGVEWLGQVPEHWDVATLKYLVTAPIIDGPHVSPIKYDEGVPFISAEAISGGKIDFNKKWGFISKEDHKLYSKRYVPKFGDLLIVKLGATTGSVAMVETHDEFNIWVPLATVRVSQKRLESKFMYYLFQSLQIKDAIQQSWTFGTQQTLGLGTISNFRIPIPTLDESHQIVKYLDEKLSKYEDIIKLSENSLNLLKERRTALISSAVTGKIDVRSWQNPNHNNNEAQMELSQ